MRFLTIAAAVLAVAQGAVAAGKQKSIIMSFPDGTGDDIVNKAMADIRKAGGTIVHEYKMIKYDIWFDLLYRTPFTSAAQFYTNRPKPRAFAANAPQGIIDTVTAWSSEYHAVIEEDQVMEISDTTL